VTTENPTVVLLKKARGLIENPANWVQGVNARNAEGKTVNSISSDATCFCAAGALLNATYTSNLVGLFTYEEATMDASNEAMGLLRKAVSGSIIDYNDNPNTTHAKVLEMFDSAIDAASKKTD
jgi:hypothetical protein